jgi:diaminopimelate epimerase
MTIHPAVSGMRFWKYSVLGNTFALVALRRAVSAPQLSWVRGLCDPEAGVAADGVALIEPSRLRVHIYNADGSRAEVSGNGARCAARWLFDHDPTLKEVSLRLDSGTLKCRRSTGRNVQVILPPPRFAASEIPARTRQAEVWGQRLPFPETRSSGVTVHALSVGNPQCVVWGARLPNHWESLGAWLHTYKLFPERTNVVFARRSGQGIDVKIWERGVGPTSSSGTGAAAAAVVGARLGKTPRRVRVHMAGGTMRVAWRKDGGIELLAPAELIAEGLWPVRRIR